MEGIWPNHGCSIGVVRPIISPFRGEDPGSNPGSSTTHLHKQTIERSFGQFQRKKISSNQPHSSSFSSLLPGNGTELFEDGKGVFCAEAVPAYPKFSGAS